MPEYALGDGADYSGGIWASMCARQRRQMRQRCWSVDQALAWPDAAAGDQRPSYALELHILSGGIAASVLRRVDAPPDRTAARLAERGTASHREADAIDGVPNRESKRSPRSAVARTASLFCLWASKPRVLWEPNPRRFSMSSGIGRSVLAVAATSP
jgi:hypothetical protein